MLFNSYVFLLVFLPIVVAGWWLLPGERLRLLFLTLASYCFYSYYEFPRGLELLPLLLASTTADFVAGHRIVRTESQRARKLWLAGALIINLGMLGVFKYLGFFEGVVNALLGLIGQPTEVPVHTLILPIGISFYTFNSMSYTIDIYRRRVQPAHSFLHYSAFVSLFPHLVAGPIVRYADIETQLRSLKTRLTSGMAATGLFFFACGLVKKLAIADTLAPTVDRLHATTDSLTVVSGWAVAIGYSMQIYFDFSGYSDMAVGLALLLGFRFPQNFDSPYKAKDISDLWRRWHVTMSRWFRDYLFIPLGGSRGSKILTVRNLVITMVLAGLWHGAAWTFIVFGCTQGTLLGIHALCREKGVPPPPLWLGRAATYLSFAAALVMFRAPTMGSAGEIYAAMIGLNGLGLHNFAITARDAGDVGIVFLALVAALLVWVNVLPNTFEYRPKPNLRTAALVGAMLAVGFMLVAAPSPFLYFQF